MPQVHGALRYFISALSFFTSVGVTSWPSAQAVLFVFIYLVVKKFRPSRFSSIPTIFLL